MLQDLNDDFLLNLLDRFNILRAVVCDNSGEYDPYYQTMYLIPMWNIVEKIKTFEPYFHKLNIIFPAIELHRHPIELSNHLFSCKMIHIKEEEFIFNGEIVKIEYKYV